MILSLHEGLSESPTLCPEGLSTALKLFLRALRRHSPVTDGELERLVPWTMDTSMDSNEKGAGHEISQPLEFPCAASMAGPVILP